VGALWEHIDHVSAEGDAGPKKIKMLKAVAAWWLPFLDTYRTMCRAPEPAFRRILEDIWELGFAA
jgi:hypothetical protein